MSDFYRQLAFELIKHPVVVATLIHTSGFVPDQIGAKMLIYGNQQTVGTIGGGLGEAKIHAQASQVLATGMNSFIEIDVELGGQMRIWLERWDRQRLPLVQQILIALETETPTAIVTPFDQSPYLLLESVNKPQFTPTGCFIEPIEPLPTLLIVGAGQIAIPLAQMAHLAEFRVIVVDDRALLTTPARFPHAVCLTNSIDVALQTLSKSRSRYAALLTPGMKQQMALLHLLLAYSMQYIGIMGSQNYQQQVLQTLSDRGSDADQLATVHTPIGLDINAQTPAEIAISICAELIQVRRDRKTPFFAPTLLNE